MKTEIYHKLIQNNLHHYTKNVENASTKENTDNIEDNSLINSCDINSKSKKSKVILGNSMLRHLNGSEMSKKVKSNCKIFVKHFSGTTNCIEDYMKLSSKSYNA